MYPIAGAAHGYLSPSKCLESIVAVCIFSSLFYQHTYELVIQDKVRFSDLEKKWPRRQGVLTWVDYVKTGQEYCAAVVLSDG